MVSSGRPYSGRTSKSRRKRSSFISSDSPQKNTQNTRSIVVCQMTTRKPAPLLHFPACPFQKTQAYARRRRQAKQPQNENQNPYNCSVENDGPFLQKPNFVFRRYRCAVFSHLLFNFRSSEKALKKRLAKRPCFLQSAISKTRQKQDLYFGLLF